MELLAAGIAFEWLLISDTRLQNPLSLESKALSTVHWLRSYELDRNVFVFFTFNKHLVFVVLQERGTI